jgi:putative tryptophan/tyrosine transport system substrate-binding protein
MKRRDFIGFPFWAAASAPVPGWGENLPTPVVGFLHFGSPGPFAYQVDAFRGGLDDSGYVEGKNVAIEYRWAEGHYDRLAAMAADLVARKVSVIAAFAPPAVRAAKDATISIPIVFGTGDAVTEGLVTSLARPDGNLTGMSLLVGTMNPKRLELLYELVPQAKLMGLLVNPNNPVAERTVQEMRDAAREKGVRLLILKAASEFEIDTAFASLVQQHADALLVGNDPFFMSRSAQFSALAARDAIPTIHGWREFVMAGGLISYGASLAAGDRQVGVYVGRILNGAKVADLPVLQPTTFELIVNLRTARSLGLTVPRSILERADEVIE